MGYGALLTIGGTATCPSGYVDQEKAKISRIHPAFHGTYRNDLLDDHEA